MKFAVLIIAALTIIGLAWADLPGIPVPETQVPGIEVPDTPVSGIEVPETPVSGLDNVGETAGATHCVIDKGANCCFSIGDKIYQELLSCATALLWTVADPKQCTSPNAVLCNAKTSLLFQICFDFSYKLGTSIC
ncbi:uncharacterized protein LOC128860911 isoform X3 [Anastrepha ludens]|uniref:uncharacterized protein LOC128860911 isoform X3 n=1 Tax=Anastrepha ludens TaxID=28586 RepID=UPI0023B1D68C|nr:uncharacterized protein LOC128860911 isoform X3 [Anastrepha ludens]